MVKKICHFVNVNRFIVSYRYPLKDSREVRDTFDGNL